MFWAAPTAGRWAGFIGDIGDIGENLFGEYLLKFCLN